ncbi:hypothetical protein CBR_g50154 [Chara braunii]|uniref:CCHC-type domain-containing protein n=1 Tax=Chara braunii TaxID=69332 RepID=A0A388M679_CHABU|nr:hypothetical protein CBR_g50154 [Chara braunii]|eukprot:GBG90061.1 hypothetical protein CBR_g50154 [Chara braunii]
MQCTLMEYLAASRAEWGKLQAMTRKTRIPLRDEILGGSATEPLVVAVSSVKTEESILKEDRTVTVYLDGREGVAHEKFYILGSGVLDTILNDHVTLQGVINNGCEAIIIDEELAKQLKFDLDRSYKFEIETADKKRQEVVGTNAGGMGGHGMVGHGMAGQGLMGQGMPGSPLAGPNSGPAAYGTVTCFICGKTGHYSRNCWQAASKQRPEEDQEMKELLRRIAKREKEEEETKQREIEETRKKEEEERREGEKLRDEEAREARLEATIVKILTHRKLAIQIPTVEQPSVDSRKRSPWTKARMIQEIRNYIAASDDESDEVRDETEKLVEALEKLKWKNKKKSPIVGKTTSRTVRKKAPQRKGKAQVTEEDGNGEGFLTPKKVGPAGGSSEDLVEYALSQTRALSAMKATELRRICDEEGVKYIVKEQAIEQIARCRTKLAYEGFFERMYKLSSRKLVALYRTAGLFSSSTTRNCLKNRISRVLKQKFGVKVRRRLYVRIPYSVQVNLSAVRDFMTKVITISVPDEAIRTLVIERMRMVKTKGRTVANIIHNYKKKLQNGEEKCTCSRSLLQRFQGHVRTRLDEIRGVHRFVLNSRNVMCGRAVNTVELLEAIIKVIPKTWRKNLLQLSGADVRRCVREQMTSPSAVTEQEVARNVRAIRSLVLVPLDRNRGATLVICPVLYFHGFRMTFSWNPGFINKA